MDLTITLFNGNKKNPRRKCKSNQPSPKNTNEFIKTYLYHWLNPRILIKNWDIGDCKIANIPIFW